MLSLSATDANVGLCRGRCWLEVVESATAQCSKESDLVVHISSATDLTAGFTIPRVQ